MDHNLFPVLINKNIFSHENPKQKSILLPITMSDNIITPPETISHVQNHVKSMKDIPLLYESLLYTITEIRKGFHDIYLQTDDKDYLCESMWWTKLFAFMSQEAPHRPLTDKSQTNQLNEFGRLISTMSVKVLTKDILLTIIHQINEDYMLAYEDHKKEGDLEQTSFWCNLEETLQLKINCPIGSEPLDMIANLRKMLTATTKIHEVEFILPSGVSFESFLLDGPISDELTQIIKTEINALSETESPGKFDIMETIESILSENGIHILNCKRMAVYLE
jgi:hypothetical protein